MIVIHERPAQHQFCELAGLLAVYLQKHEDGADRLREFLTDERGLWDTGDVCSYSGWGRQYISQLCSQGTLPYIPGRPNKFVPAAVKKALEAMQQGGPYGRRKSTLKPKGRK